MSFCDRCGRQTEVECFHATRGTEILCTLCLYLSVLGGVGTVDVGRLLGVLYTQKGGGLVCNVCGVRGRDSHRKGCVVRKIENLVGGGG